MKLHNQLAVTAFTLVALCVSLFACQSAHAIGRRSVVVQKQVVVNRGFRSANVVVRRNFVAQPIVVAQPFYAQQFVAPQQIIAQPVVSGCYGTQQLVAPQAVVGGCQALYSH